MNFPEFMFSEKNKIPASQQNTPDIEGYYYTANDGSQMAFWIYKADRVSKEHMHDYDEWMLCVDGEYIVFETSHLSQYGVIANAVMNPILDLGGIYFVKSETNLFGSFSNSNKSA